MEAHYQLTNGDRLDFATGAGLLTEPVKGSTADRAGVPLTLVAARDGATGGWCGNPEREQASGSAGWSVGGPHSGASVKLLYALPDGDEVQFTARADPRGGAVGCEPIDHGGRPADGCLADWREHSGRDVAAIDFRIFRLVPGRPSG